MGLSAFMAWLAQTDGSIALHESLYAYPIVETVHVLAIALFGGTLAMIDLRLLGRACTGVPVSEMTRRLLPWTLAGFVVLVITGLLLFYAIPVRTYHSLWFRLKVLLMVVAALNAWWLHRRIARDRGQWDSAPTPPRAARVAAALSLAAWIGVIVAGRMIAYNWADCDRPQPAWVRVLAECRSGTR